MSLWLEIDVERTLTVDRGRNVILCDRSNAPSGETLIVLVSPESIDRLRNQIDSPPNAEMNHAGSN